MEMKEVIARINELAAKNKTVGLTDEELAVYKRGRNAHSATKAKNATRADYHKATGFEALVGYLYLTEQTVLRLLLWVLLRPAYL